MYVCEWQSLKYVRHFRIHNRFSPIGTKHSNISNSQLNTAIIILLSMFLATEWYSKSKKVVFYSVAVRVWEFDERLKIYPAEEKAFLKCIFSWNHRLFSPYPFFAWKYHCNSGEFHKQSPQNQRASKQSAICTYLYKELWCKGVSIEIFLA